MTRPQLIHVSLGMRAPHVPSPGMLKPCTSLAVPLDCCMSYRTLALSYIQIFILFQKKTAAAGQPPSLIPELETGPST
jgi:hypothetical protein